jgi:hypothetical protein
MQTHHKFFFAGVVLFLSSTPSLLAQTIQKVGNDRVTISEAQSLKKGDQVHFLDSSLETKAKGVVEKTSAQGNTVIVQVTEGTVLPSYSIEKSTETKPVATPKVVETAALSEEERKILDRGPIGTTAYVLGGVLGTYPFGLGIGHAIQGRYSDKGLIFTVGELASVGVILIGVADSCSSINYSASSSSLNCNGSTTLLALGLGAYIGLRVWEIIDLWAGPPEHNRRFEQISARDHKPQSRLLPVIIPSSDQLVMGLQFRY